MRIAKLALPLAILSFGVAAHGAIAQRSYVAGQYQLLIDNVPAAFVAKVSGGGATAEVVTDKIGTTGTYPKKHAGAVKYEDISFAVNGPMEAPLAKWVKETLASATPSSKPGSIVTLDVNHNEMSRISWQSAFISDFTFPELDAGTRDVGHILLTLAPTSTKLTQGNGAKQTAAAGLKTKAGVINTANFRINLSGLEAPMASVNHIDAMSVRFSQVTNQVGDQREMRDYEKTPGKVDVSNLVFTIAENKADPIVKWHEKFVVEGKNGDENERTGSIELLTPDLRTVIYKLNLKGVGIIKYTPVPVASAAEGVRRLRFECYVESVSLD